MRHYFPSVRQINNLIYYSESLKDSSSRGIFCEALNYVLSRYFLMCIIRRKKKCDKIIMKTFFLARDLRSKRESTEHEEARPRKINARWQIICSFEESNVRFSFLKKKNKK